MSTQMKQRRGTAAQWASEDPILDEGVLGWDSTNKIIKVGDGVTAWSALNPHWVEVSGGAMAGGLILQKAPVDPTEAVRLIDSNTLQAELTDFKDNIWDYTAIREVEAELSASVVLNDGDPITDLSSWTLTTNVGGWAITTGGIEVPLDGYLAGIAEFEINPGTANGQGNRAIMVYKNTELIGMWNVSPWGDRQHIGIPLAEAVVAGDIIYAKAYTSGGPMTVDHNGAIPTFIRAFIL